MNNVDYVEMPVRVGGYIQVKKKKPFDIDKAIKETADRINMLTYHRPEFYTENMARDERWLLGRVINKLQDQKKALTLIGEGLPKGGVVRRNVTA